MTSASNIIHLVNTDHLSEYTSETFYLNYNKKLCITNSL